MHCNPHTWLTIIIACIAVYIAWQQSLTAQNKLKYDLFDRRFKIYEAAKLYIEKNLKNNFAFVDGEYEEYRIKILGAQWLLKSKETERYLLHELPMKVGRMKELKALSIKRPEEEEQLKSDIYNQFEILDTHFHKLLTIHEAFDLVGSIKNTLKSKNQ